MAEILKFGGYEDYEIVSGNCLDVMSQMDAETFDAVIGDPPYCSGGGSWNRPSSAKYTNTKKKCPIPDFDGESVHPIHWYRNMVAVSKEAYRITKTGGVIAFFIDWRNYEFLSQAIQEAGWVWRGVITWVKSPNSCRPQPGRPRQQSEFVLWGSKVSMPLTRNAPVIPGAFTYKNVTSPDRLHQTQKPLELMRDLVRICERSGSILGPFAGSGTTVLAAKLEGFHALGIESKKYFADLANERIKKEG